MKSVCEKNSFFVKIYTYATSYAVAWRGVALLLRGVIHITRFALALN